MGDIRALDRQWPELLIRIETSGNLELGHVGAFLQRLNTAVRRSRPAGAPIPRVELVSIETGSIKFRIAVASLAVTAAALAIQVADYLKSDPAAVRSTYTLIQGDNATVITIQGDETSASISPNEVEDMLQQVERRATRRMVGGAGPAVALPELITGPQSGIIHQFGGANWIALDSRPGMSLEIEDRRAAGSEPLRENLRYTIDGQAHIGADGARSYFIMRDAILHE